jgi:hypothetical protein
MPGLLAHATQVRWRLGKARGMPTTDFAMFTVGKRLY